MFLYDELNDDDVNSSIPSDLDKSKKSEENLEKSEQKNDKLNDDNVNSSILFEFDESKKSEENLEEDKQKADEHDGFSKIFSDYRRQSAGIVSEIKKKEVYLKPSVRRKLKSELARKKRNRRRKNYRFGKRRGS